MSEPFMTTDLAKQKHHAFHLISCFIIQSYPSPDAQGKQTPGTSVDECDLRVLLHAISQSFHIEQPIKTAGLANQKLAVVTDKT